MDPDRYWYQPLAPSVEGAEVAFEAVPESWTLGQPAVPLRVRFRNAPAGAGLEVVIGRDLPWDELRAAPSSGGGLTQLPIPVEGDGVVDVRLEGIAFSAPEDAPDPFPLKPGPHRLVARLINHRRLTIGLVIRQPTDRTLAEALSEPILIRD